MFGIMMKNRGNRMKSWQIILTGFLPYVMAVIVFIAVAHIICFKCFCVFVRCVFVFLLLVS